MRGARTPPPDLDERLARIEEKMATRDDVGELRALIKSRNSPMRRWLGGAVVVLGFQTRVLIFTR